MPKVTPLVCHGPGFELGILVPSLHAYTVTLLYSAVVPYTVICCVPVILLQEERKKKKKKGRVEGHPLLSPKHPSTHWSDLYYHSLVLPVLEVHINGIRQHAVFCVWASFTQHNVFEIHLCY